MSKHAPRPPSWPATNDQRRQSRPLIYLRPLRHLRNRMLDSNPPDKDGVRVLTAAQLRLLEGLRNASRPTIERFIAEAA